MRLTKSACLNTNSCCGTWSTGTRSPVIGFGPRFCVFEYCVLALIAIPSRDPSGPLPCVRQRTQGDLVPLGAQTTYRPSIPDSRDFLEQVGSLARSTGLIRQDLEALHAVFAAQHLDQRIGVGDGGGF